MKALLLIALLGQTKVREATLTVDPTGEVRYVQGGAYLTAEETEAQGAKLADLRAQNQVLNSEPKVETGTWVGVAVGIVLGLAGGFMLRGFFRK